jgi:hypothetical protein
MIREACSISGGGNLVASCLNEFISRGNHVGKKNYLRFHFVASVGAAEIATYMPLLANALGCSSLS